MKRYNKNSAYILVSTLFIISFIALLTQQLLRRMGVQAQFNSIIVAREKAEMIALGGINLAIGQLTAHEHERDETKIGEDDKKDPDEKTKKLLSTLLPHINRWQTFQLKENLDGVNGELRICISCENGKINVNKSFDFNKKEFSPEFKNILGAVTLKGKVKLAPGEFLKRLTEFMRKRGKPIDDISELMSVPGFETLALFYNPPERPVKKGQSPERLIALSDLFTVWSSSSSIEPWLLSDIVRLLWGLNRPKWNDADTMKETFKKTISQFKKGLGAKWNENWQVLAPIYGNTPRNFNVVQKILSQQFDPTVYTVISSGKVHDVQQKLLAVLEKKEMPSTSKDNSSKKQEKPEVQKKTAEPGISFKIVKLYWL
jgi:hypothetical protein